MRPSSIFNREQEPARRALSLADGRRRSGSVVSLDRYRSELAVKDLQGKVVVVGNLKGGTGKSTMTVNLAACLSNLGRKVVVIDSDPQATSYQWLSEHGDLMAVHQMPVERLATVPNWIAGMRDLRQRFDIVFVDLPAVVAPALASGFLVADLILVPLSVSAIDMKATERVLKFIRITREERPANPPRVLLAPNRVSPSDISNGRIAKRLAPLRELVAPPIRESEIISHAFEKRCPAADIAAGSPLLSDFLALTARLMSELDAVEPVVQTPAPTGDGLDVAAAPSSGAGSSDLPDKNHRKRRTRPAAADFNPEKPFPDMPHTGFWKRFLGKMVKSKKAE